MSGVQSGKRLTAKCQCPWVWPVLCVLRAEAEVRGEEKKAKLFGTRDERRNTSRERAAS